jgi:hypothetical protein
VRNRQCSTDDECGRNGYCATNGKCKRLGRCGVEADCENPANVFDVDDCEGQLVCNPDRTCGIKCTQEEELTYTEFIAGSSCASDKDCGNEGYCNAGQCAALGSCVVDADCFNPSNVYPVAACVGYVYCAEEQICDINCTTGSFCPPDAEQVNCFADPCEANNCPESVSCVSNYCGGCNSFNFNEAGFQVCNNGTTLPVLEEEPRGNDDCSTNKDCREEEYCMAGTCAAIGACVIDDDCHNPFNNYPHIDCVGYKYCSEEGTCGVQCTENGTSCPKDVEEVNCFADPCEVSDCRDSVNCVSNYCGGCSTYNFDPAGNSICKDNTA